MNFDYNMARVNKIIRHTDYKKYLVWLSERERGRKFCCHNLSHFLDVARIAQVINLEMKLNINVELIYSAALLHDIGKAVEDTENIGHSKLSARLTKPILHDCGFLDCEIEFVLDAILKHNNEKTKGVTSDSLTSLLYRADKLSRPCYMCDARDLCYWSLENKNLQLKI